MITEKRKQEIRKIFWSIATDKNNNITEAQWANLDAKARKIELQQAIEALNYYGFCDLLKADGIENLTTWLMGSFGLSKTKAARIAKEWRAQRKNEEK